MTFATVPVFHCRGGACPARRAPARSTLPCAARPRPHRGSSPSVISSVARPRPLRADFARRNLSYGLSGSFSGDGTNLAGSGAGFGALPLPTVKNLRIFSSRFGPSPRIASKSSTLLNGPYDLRIFRILSAVAGPIPGTSCSSSELAVLRLTGRSGGFFFPNAHVHAKRHRIRETRIAGDRHIMSDV